MTKNFTTPEILNKYRHSDKNIDNKIKQKEMIEKYENLDKFINKNIDKIKEKNQLKILQPTIILQTIMMMMMMMMIISQMKLVINIILIFLININKNIDLIMMKTY